MKKPKKITVKPFLNDKLEAVEATIQDSNGGEKVEFQYPLYYMVIYNRNNTKFKSRLGIYYSKMEDVPAPVIEFESVTIEKILRHQISVKGDNVDLKGLGNTFNLLSQDLLQCVEKYLKNKLKLVAIQADARLSFIINFNDWRNPFTKYHEVVMSLFKGAPALVQEGFKREIEAYNHYRGIHAQMEKHNQRGMLGNPSIIDWMNGEHKQFIIGKMDGGKGFNGLVGLIDNAVEKNNKWLD